MIHYYLRFSGLLTNDTSYSETTLVSHLRVLLILDRFLIRYRADHRKIKQKNFQSFAIIISAH